MLTEGMETVAQDYARGATRLRFLFKDPKGWEQFYEGLKTHSAQGSASTYQGIQLKRPTVYALEEQLKNLQVLTLLMIGDEDEPAVFMKRVIPNAGLAVPPEWSRHQPKGT